MGSWGIEAEAAMLGQPISMNIPKSFGLKLKRKIKRRYHSNRSCLTITQLLREHGVVGKFVEFYGDGLSSCHS